MATFKTVVLKHHFRDDGTARVKIRVTHNRKSAYIDTGLVVTRADITKSYELKTGSFVDHTNTLIKKYRQRINQDPDGVINMSVSDLIEYIQQREQGIDFIAFALQEIERIKAEGRKGTATNYNTAINALKLYAGSHLAVKDITVSFLRGFESFVRGKENKTRAVSLYMSQIRALHNELRRRYNNEETGHIRVPYSPFASYRIPKEKPARKRALTAEQVRAIMQLQDKAGAVRFNLAKDCFILSFYLIGMNSADLYNCPPVKAGRVTYKRMKTRSRRQDEALISIGIPLEAKRLIKKYAAKNRAFKFSKMYRDENTFNAALNKGLKQVGNAVKIEDLEFYAARHSWASIAVNDCDLDKYLVHEALNHVDEAMRVTDFYITKDWTRIDKANRVVIDYIKKSP